MKILVTGSAGFIGFHVVEKLMDLGFEVVGLDNINDYYDVNLKYARLKISGILEESIEYNKIIASSKYAGYKFIKLDLNDHDGIDNLFQSQQFDLVCNFAAQAGVRYSLENPRAYINSNVSGFLNILEACRNNNVHRLVYASSSSVYGLNKKQPFSTDDNVDNPISLYAATKKSNELMAHCYSHLFGISTIGLRFFTVYGPWGRPDMAPILFASAINEGRSIKVFNYGDLERDFTYIDDIVDGIIRIIKNFPSNITTYKLYNIGNNRPVKLNKFIQLIEANIGKDAVKELLPMQQGDVYSTYADIEPLTKDYGYTPLTNIEEGINKFITWFNEFYK